MSAAEADDFKMQELHVEVQKKLDGIESGIANSEDVRMEKSCSSEVRVALTLPSLVSSPGHTQDIKEAKRLLKDFFSCLEHLKLKMADMTEEERKAAKKVRCLHTFR